MVDFGTVCNVLGLELTEGPCKTHPSEIRIDVSTDGIDFREQKELTGVAWAGAGKTVYVDLRTVGGALQARYLRIRMKHPPAQSGKAHGDRDFFCAQFAKVRVKCAAD